MNSYFKKLSWALLLIVISTHGCAKSDSGEGSVNNRSSSPQEQIRPAAKAGSWYTSDAEELRQQISGFLDAAKTAKISGPIVGLVAPHAGYNFSGPTAGHSYKQVADEKYETIIVMAPNHGYEGGFAGASVYPGDGYATPLGISRVNKKLAKAIVDAADVAYFSTNGHGGEHSLEMQLPFIQLLFPDTKIVPIVMGSIDWHTCQSLGKAIAKAVGDKKILIVASSDLYHAPSQMGNWYDECVATNTATLAAIEKFDAHAFNKGVATGDYQCCGSGPITALMVAAKELGANAAKVVYRTNSGDVTGKKSGYIVGYGAVVIYKSDGEKSELSKDKSDSKSQSDHLEFEPLNVEVQKQLLRMAREAIEYYLQTGKRKEFKPTYEVMKEKRGVFVTITKHGRLRGCIGYHENDRPLYELVPDRALAAAFGDPRFPKLNKYELDDIKIKISVYLTNVYKIHDISEFEMGEHGIIMYKNGRGATYLPEVPIEAGWKTVDEEMANLCHKAGLPADAWREGAEFYVYKTQVFGEDMLK